ncbi:MAG: hypothetical protein HKL84_03385 [Acidimicrobiaceae bacterium]|nr:hypothetical protein [Acidimicrobiaceae bacterium]
MTVTIPPEVSTFLAGKPVMGSAEQVVPLLTIDSNGFPHACLLSRAQLDATDTEVRAAITSWGTRENLRNHGVALILVTLGDTVHHLKVGVLHAHDENRVLLVAFELIAYKSDSLGIEIQPMTFLAGPWISSLEHWDETAIMLRSLGDR